MRYVSKVMAAGVLAGTLDILFASMLTWLRGRSIEHMLQAIASGILGKAAFQAGLAGAILGLMSHLLIAVAMAHVFALVARRWRYALDHWVQAVVAFGVGSWAAMQYVVVPLSAAPFKLPNRPAEIGLSLFSHIVLVGLPIAMIVRGAHRGRESRLA